jgi:hypothetical protein
MCLLRLAVAGRLLENLCANVHFFFPLLDVRLSSPSSSASIGQYPSGQPHTLLILQAPHRGATESQMRGQRFTEEGRLRDWVDELDPEPEFLLAMAMALLTL